MSPVSTVEDFEVEHKGSDSKLGKVEAEESYGDVLIDCSTVALHVRDVT